jgi:hypothetical protein
MREPRDPLLKVVFYFFLITFWFFHIKNCVNKIIDKPCERHPGGLSTNSAQVEKKMKKQAKEREATSVHMFLRNQLQPSYSSSLLKASFFFQ